MAVLSLVHRACCSLAGALSSGPRLAWSGTASPCAQPRAIRSHLMSRHGFAQGRFTGLAVLAWPRTALVRTAQQAFHVLTLPYLTWVSPQRTVHLDLPPAVDHVSFEWTQLPDPTASTDGRNSSTNGTDGSSNGTVTALHIVERFRGPAANASSSRTPSVQAWAANASTPTAVPHVSFPLDTKLVVNDTQRNMHRYEQTL